MTVNDLDEGMRIFFVCADAKDEAYGSVEAKIDLLKIPAFEIVWCFKIALEEKRMLKFCEQLHTRFIQVHRALCLFDRLVY